MLTVSRTNSLKPINIFPKFARSCPSFPAFPLQLPASAPDPSRSSKSASSALPPPLPSASGGREMAAEGGRGTAVSREVSGSSPRCRPERRHQPRREEERAGAASPLHRRPRPARRQQRAPPRGCGRSGGAPLPSAPLRGGGGPRSAPLPCRGCGPRRAPRPCRRSPPSLPADGLCLGGRGAAARRGAEEPREGCARSGVPPRQRRPGGRSRPRRARADKAAAVLIPAAAPRRPRRGGFPCLSPTGRKKRMRGRRKKGVGVGGSGCAVGRREAALRA